MRRNDLETGTAYAIQPTPEDRRYALGSAQLVRATAGTIPDHGPIPLTLDDDSDVERSPGAIAGTWADHLDAVQERAAEDAEEAAAAEATAADAAAAAQALRLLVPVEALPPWVLGLPGYGSGDRGGISIGELLVIAQAAHDAALQGDITDES